MTREETLDKAKAVVTKDRNDQYGDPENVFGAIAYFWSAYLGRYITPKDVAVMMILLKCARTKHKVSDDTWYAEYRRAMDIYRDSEHEARKKDFVPRKKYKSWEARRYGKGGQR